MLYTLYVLLVPYEASGPPRSLLNKCLGLLPNLDKRMLVSHLPVLIGLLSPLGPLVSITI